jgi:hypothetical protein
MVMSRNKNAEENHYIRIRIESLERIEQFKYFGNPLINQNYVHKKLRLGLLLIFKEF